MEIYRKYLADAVEDDCKQSVLDFILKTQMEIF